MENIQYKLKANKNMKRFLYSYVTIFVIFFSSLFILLESFRFVEKKMKINENKSVVQKELNKIEENIKNKQKEISKLGTNEGQEIYFRETLPVSLPDEKVIVLYKPTSSSLLIMSTSTGKTWFEFKKRVNYFVDNYTNL
jgi:cell division protein FtsB